MNLFGYIFDWSGFKPDKDMAGANFAQFEEAMLAARNFRDVSETGLSKSIVNVPPRWKVVLFQSSEPLAGEEPNFLGSFEYRLLVRVNEMTNSVIIAAARYKISDAAISTFNVYTTPKLRRKIIAIPDLASHLLDENVPKKFAITFFKADVPGFGAALRSITLEGDDVFGAGFLQRGFGSGQFAGEAAVGGGLSVFTARQIGIRPINSRSECGRFGNNGTVQFSDDAIPQLERFLAYAYSQGLYID